MDHPLRSDDRTGGRVDVVGDVEQSGDELPVTPDDGLPRRSGGVLHETALRTERHDHGVLDRLRLHQAQNLGAIVLGPVRPAQPTARDETEAQMHTLHPG